MSLSFYRAFEDKYRGARETIKSRLTAYFPFIFPLQSLYGSCVAVDLGCGRGEWLELLLEHGFDAKGIDLDEGMLASCKERGLPAELGDAIAYLQSLEDESVTIVSGFHLAEHIPFESLQILVAEALRVLKPAGLLILETPNAENLTVGSHSFYLDPTHEKPLPYPLLSFVTEYAGFERNKLVRLQEEEELRDGDQASLIEVLQGVSPDYAIVAQKYGPAWQTVLFDRAFNQEYGLALGAIAHRYEVNQQYRHQQQEEQVVHLKEQTAQLKEQVVQQAEAFTEQVNQQAQQTDQMFNEIQQSQQGVDQKLEQLLQWQAQEKSQLQHEVQHYAHIAEQQSQLVASIVGSKSWRLTAPLRHSTALLKGEGQGQIKLKAKSVVKKGLRKSMQYVLARPGLRQRLNQGLQRYPTLYSRLLRFARNQGLVHGGEAMIYVQEERQALRQQPLNPRAQEIYAQLTQAIQDKQVEVK